MICHDHNYASATGQRCPICVGNELQAGFEADGRQLGERIGLLQPRAADGVIDKATQYNAGSIECIDAIQAALTPEEYRGFLKGNVIKYTWREKHKGGEESLKKAQWYLARLLALALALGGVSGCGSDYASPFDKPDETTLPVACAASAPCQQ